MKTPKQERHRRDRAGGMQHDPTMSGDKPAPGRSVERERGTIRPEMPEREPAQKDVIR